MSRKPETVAEKRAQLVLRAAAEREALSRQLQPFTTLEGALEQLSGRKQELPGMSLGVGLGLSALLLAFPGGQAPLLRGGLALIRLANSVRTLFRRR